MLSGRKSTGAVTGSAPPARATRITERPKNQLKYSQRPSAEIATPLSPEMPASDTKPRPGCHSYTAPAYCPLAILACACGSFGSKVLVTMKASPGRGVTALSQALGGSTAQPVHVSRGSAPLASTANTSTDSRPP